MEEAGDGHVSLKTHVLSVKCLRFPFSSVLLRVLEAGCQT